MNAGRDTRGRFAPGNKGGPGRPRRAVERDYLTKLSDTVSLGDWGRIVQKAVEDAIMGDRHARDFIAKHVLSETPGTLRDLSAKESAGLTVKHELIQGANQHRDDHLEMIHLQWSSPRKPSVMTEMFPIEVGELASETSSGSQNGAPSPATSTECKNEADCVVRR